MGKQWKLCQTLFFRAPKSLQMVIAAMKLKDTYSLEGNLDSILKSRDITLPTKVHLVIAMVFPVVMYRCESWTIKKAEQRRIDAFELWCGVRLLRVPWTVRRSNQSMLKEISPEYSLEGLLLKLHYFGYWCEELTHWKRPWSWERWKAGGEREDRRWRWLDGISNTSLSKLWDLVMNREAWRAAVHWFEKSQDTVLS